MTVAAEAGGSLVSGPPASVPTEDAVGGRAERFTAAYRRYGSRVLGYLRARGVDDPESVTQEVFLALYGRIDDIAGGDDGVRALLFAIAHARMVDQFRADARRPVVTMYVAEADPRLIESAEEVVVTAAGDHAALALLGELADEHREVVALRIIAGMTLAETAEVMGRSEGAVKQLQRRALEKLRDRISVRNSHG